MATDRVMRLVDISVGVIFVYGRHCINIVCIVYKWVTHGLGSDFAMSAVIVCNLSLALYLLQPGDGNTDASITNPHTSNALIITARRTPPPQSARRGEVAVVRSDRVAVGYITPIYNMRDHVQSRVHRHCCYHACRWPRHRDNPIVCAYHVVGARL